MFHFIKEKQQKTWEIAFISEDYHRLSGINRARVEYFLLHMDTMTEFTEESVIIANVIKDVAAEPKNMVAEGSLTGMDGVKRRIKCDLYSTADDDGTAHIYGHLIDMTDYYDKQEQLHIREEEGAAVLMQSGKMIYRYNINGRQAVLPDQLAALFELPQEIDNWPQWAVDRSRIQPESHASWLAMFDAIDRGEKSGAAEIHFCKGADIDKRYRMQFTGVSNSIGIPVSAIISIEDVTSEYERTRVQGLETEGLLTATREMFPEVIILNLDRNEYRIMQYEGYTTRGTDRDGIIDDMINIRIPAVLEEDRQLFIDTFSGERLREAFIKQGKGRVSAVYRRLDQDGKAFWFETTAIRMENPYDNDVLIVAVSRNMDEQKAEEERLRQELQLQSEELRLTMGQVGKSISYYDINTSTLTIPPTATARLGLPQRIENFPECMEGDLQIRDEYTPEGLEAIRAFYKAIRRGEPVGSCELQFIEKDGTARWEQLEFATIRDEKGLPRKAVISVEDITAQHEQTMENLRLREQERLLQSVARHSDRTVCYYDFARSCSGHWSEENCAGCILPKLCQQSLEEMLKDPKLMPESVDTVKTMFDDIHRGVREDRVRLHIKDDEGIPRWLDMKYSTRFDKEHKPIAVMFSYADITEQYEKEMAYQRYSVMLEADEGAFLVIETDLTLDKIVRQGGTMQNFGLMEEGISHEAFRDMIRKTSVSEEGLEEANRFFSREYLLTKFTDGSHHLVGEWPAMVGGKECWLRASMDMIRDPYTQHIKGFCRVIDFTREHDEMEKVQRRAERDAMTGLLNRGTCEERIKQLIEDGSDMKGGVLLLMDLDDLKGINDAYGHEQGDRAIRGIADTIKTHFREGDIIGRIGGDEFMVFLRKASGKEDAITLSINSLLRKLALISIGDNNERSLQCSIGCTSEILGKDSFESMYKRADLALYHVKRHGKNDFAFYSAEMEQADYQYRKEGISIKDTRNVEWIELQNLITAISAFYPMIVSFNLTQNVYYLMETANPALLDVFMPTGKFNDFVKAGMSIIHPDDRQYIMDNLTREDLVAARENGKSSVTFRFRYYKAHWQKYVWVEYVYVFYDDDNGDCCCFGLLRIADDDREKEMELLRMQKVLEIAVSTAFEYFCLVDVQLGTYTLYDNDGKNTHGITDTGVFDEVTVQISRSYISEEEQQEYFNKANLRTVINNMREKGAYQYQYTMPDGKREASFYWYEPTHAELLMTVRKV